ncbi:MAG: Ribonuclease VapC15 [Candidatus Hydrogenedentes bacterium ADurb.Bin101]|nr:MAG: Ribonuclease VapC15 [Candidatus Hydrogenedentes bacterium ADurb.Bin101]
MSVLVDTSVWIDYFRGEGSVDTLDRLIDQNLVVVNELILAELLPFLYQKRQRKLAALLQELQLQPMCINWTEIIEMQTVCLRNGINGVGIPDLMIAQNVLQGGLSLFSRDRHFSLMATCITLSMYE